MRRGILLGALALAACSGHPEEGTVVEPGPGVAGLPGGSKGISASRAVPISGGTLLVADDGVTAIAADPDRDRVWLVDLDTQHVREIALQAGDEPGRAALDAQGRVHVALRRGGGVVAIDLATAAIVHRVSVCPAPRGVAYDAPNQLLHVACQTGELVSLDSSGGVVRKLELGRDLRDVVVDSANSRLLVSRFRSAELLVVDAGGLIRHTTAPRGSQFEQRSPFIAWRTLADPNGGVLMLHQRGSDGEVGIQSGGYGMGVNPCGGGAIVDVTITRVDPDDASQDSFGMPQTPLPSFAGPTDMSVSRDGNQLAIVNVGNAWGEPGPLPRAKLMVVPIGTGPVEVPCMEQPPEAPVDGEPTAVAHDGKGRVVVQSREPAQLQIVGGPTIVLSTDSRADTGVALFHMNAGSGVSCSSCHAEGGEDGRTWTFASLGPRRTQSLAGGIAQRAPFHWDGTLDSFHTLVNEVFVSRMSGPRPNKTQTARFADYIDTFPAPVRAQVDGAAAARGQALFEDPVVGCSSCHSGPDLSSNLDANVGTGGLFQVPSLVGIGARPPFMHDGCASTLLDRFGPCGGGDAHGKTSQLSAAQIDDLVTFLESL